ncbi:beta-mannosidase [Carboxylicivirga sp. N1Y90]|uniref:beta-mannosidase n=1 Tax=Carboxylicivirga fragile TaxID=3417571 RepID=UPI003D34FFE9|nr:glycoside hydrolase family 2 protein [Marinilabiliaceae bacterium N1Y90]
MTSQSSVWISLFTLSTLLFMSCSESHQATRRELNATWSFKQVGTKNWMPANVPGNVHTDLEANDLINNPFYGTNEDSLQWIEHEDWHYSGEFTIDELQFKQQHIELEFLGLDTYADVKLNDQHLLKGKNMFLAYSHEVKDLLIIGKNKIEFIFHSPIKMALPKHLKSKYTYPADNDRSEEHLSVYTRKAPYHYGWDWGPRFVTSGIWRPIMIKTWNEARFDDIQFVQNKLADDEANITLTYQIESDIEASANIELFIDENKNNSQKILLNKGINTVNFSTTINNPERWWPNGMGEAHLYQFTSKLSIGNKIVDKKTMQIGLRTIEVINKPDSIGESFYLKVNDIPTFIKGANHIPNDCFLGRMTDSVYQRNFDDALNSNMNMLRVWGGGIYEDQRFYELADEKGILIWQDFMFACTMYPSDDEFFSNIEDEAEYNIKRLRNHASLALWCGNNEIKVGWDNWGWQNKYNYDEADQKELLEGYDKLFNQLLPNKVKELDPQRFYYDSSPISNWGNKADMKIADNHYWGVWWGKHEFKQLNEYVPRFMSEFGFQSFPSMSTIKSFSKKNDWDIDSDVMKSHQKSSIGNITIKEYMQRDYHMPEKFEDFVYLNQVMQAEGMRIGFEAHRRNKPFNMGTLYWQFNDVWPVVSWSGIDYYGRWKAMQYFIKKAFEPIISSAVFDNDKLKVHLISDRIHSTEVHSLLKIITLDGKQIWQLEKNLILDANANVQILNQSLANLIKGNKLHDLVLVMTTKYDSKETENTFLFSKVKELELVKHDIDIKIKTNKNIAELIIKSPVFVKNLELSTSTIDGQWSDNYFDLMPNKEYRVTLESAKPILDLEEEIQLKSIVDTY